MSCYSPPPREPSTLLTFLLGFLGALFVLLVYIGVSWVLWAELT